MGRDQFLEKRQTVLHTIHRSHKNNSNASTLGGGRTGELAESSLS
jgi:hypothetical protein